MELISKEYAIQLLIEDFYASRSRGDDERASACVLHCIDISNLPVIEERKEGYWSYEHGCRSHCYTTGFYICSVCHRGIARREGDYSPNFCPNCGARMKGK